MHPKPGSECDGALDLMPMLSDLRDGGVPADHRHDALVLVRQWLRRLSSKLAQDVLCRPPARLLRDGPQLWQGCAVVLTGGDVRDVADRVNTWEAVDRQIGEDLTWYSNGWNW
jgi:hypothetical protein